MKSFILKTIGFILALSILPYACQYVYDYAAQKYVYDWPYTQINKVYSNSENPDLLIIGNSRGGSYLTEVFDTSLNVRSQNISLAAYPFDFLYHVMYGAYKRSNRFPRYIIQDIGPWCFFQDINPRFRIEFLPYINRPEFDFYIESCPELSMLDRYLPIKYHGHLFDCISNYIDFRSEPDSVNVNMNMLRLDDSYTSDAFNGETFHPLERDEEKVLLFRAFINECRKNGILVVLVCSPIHTRDGYSHFDMDGFRHLVTDIATTDSIPFLDFSGMFGADDTYFRDPMHIKTSKRKQFTEAVCIELKEIIRRNQ